MPHLLVLGGPEALKRFAIETDQIVIGRGESADVTVADRNASARHCRIERTGGGFRISDLESQNGTWINGKRVRRKPLRAGDVIAVGTTELRFEGEDATPLPTEAARSQEREMARMRKLVSWTRRLTNERDHARLLKLMLESVVEITGAERGFLMLLESAGKLSIRVTHEFDLEALRKPTYKVARNIAERVARRGQPVVSMNADEDPAIKTFGDTGALNLRSVACVPIRAGSRVLGALYLDNRFERGALRTEDLPFLLAFADQAAIALENARLHAEAAEAKRELERLNGILKGRVEEQERELHAVSALYAQASDEARSNYTYDAIIGRSAPMREMLFLLDRVTDSEVPVYLCGESGTGKELAARAIHFNGARQQGPFVTENCAAIPESLFESELFGHKRGSFTGASADKKGLFQLAEGGTLFLDEIGEMPVSMQAKLLRALQEKEVRPVGAGRTEAVDVRIVTASNRDLAEEVRRGRFREDLFHRIHVIEIVVPPLRRRREDIGPLVEHFLARLGDRPLRSDAFELLTRYDWPGNVRELENEIVRAHTLADGEIGPEHLSAAVRSTAGTDGLRGVGLKEAVRRAGMGVERRLITEALRLEDGNKSAVARRLGISRPTLDAKMEQLKIPRHPA
ncbi:MAG: sigma 54-interacting transcriptional regulator [Planctomycetota bacterium]|jgi:transcriptional regulator with GAF, ATPase, and Fis domain